MSPAMLRRFISSCGVAVLVNPSAIHMRASPSAEVSLASKADSALFGKIRLCTSAAQTTPTVISSTRDTAVSNTAPGASTLGKPIKAAV